MKKLLVAAAIFVGGFSLLSIADYTPAMAQAGGDLGTPRKSDPRIGKMKRDDSMNAGRRMRMGMHHKRKHRMHHRSTSM